MLCFDSGGTEMRIAHATLHASLRRAIKILTRDRVLNAIRSTDSALRRMGVAHPRIAVSGLNPHAGEGGLFGDEEQAIIGPAIVDAKKNDVDADGPFGADVMFLKKGYDAFVVMIHDQGHIMAKTHAFSGAAALTLGTPVLFSSVAHGSALDIAGKNRADPGAIISAIERLVGEMHGHPRGAVKRIAAELLDEFGLNDATEEFAVNYSMGMKKKLGLACALIHNPPVLILDEPINGLDPRAAREVQDRLRKSAAERKTIFLSTHLLDMAERICTRVGIIHKGELVAAGPLETLR